MLDTLACSVVYVLSLVAVFGIAPARTLQKSTAPFVLGIPVYFAQRDKMTEPEPVPEYR